MERDDVRDFNGFLVSVIVANSCDRDALSERDADCVGASTDNETDAVGFCDVEVDGSLVPVTDADCERSTEMLPHVFDCVLDGETLSVGVDDGEMLLEVAADADVVLDRNPADTVAVRVGMPDVETVLETAIVSVNVSMLCDAPEVAVAETDATSALRVTVVVLVSSPVPLILGDGPLSLNVPPD